MASAAISMLSCIPRYTDAAACWVTQESQVSYSLYFNPAQGPTLEDLARTIENHAREMTKIASQNSPVKANLDIQVQTFTIRGQVYARQYLPNYKAGDVLRDREGFNVVVWQRAVVGGLGGAGACIIS